MRAEVARLSPGDVAGYERFLTASEAIFQVGFEQLGDVPFGSWTDMARVLPDLVRLEGYRTVYVAGLQARARRAAAHGAELPPAAGRRQSVHDDLDLLPDRVPRAALGRALRRWAAPAAWCTGLVGLIEGQGGARALQPRRSRRSP